MKIIKNSINNLLAFILMSILAMLLVFMIFENNLSLNRVIKNMNNTNYYNKVYNNLIEKINDFIILEDVQEQYKDYVKIDLIKEDINKIVKGIYDENYYKVNRYDDFYNIMFEYSKDEEVSEKYAHEINNIYKANLFPVMPFKLINKLYLKNNIQFVIIITLSLLILFLGYILYIINKSYKYVVTSFLGMSILIILPNIFLKLFKVFDGFIYTNEYFTNIILKIIYNTFNTLTIIGIVNILIIFVLWLIKEFRKK